MSSLNQFNQDQYQHYHTLVPVIYQVSQRHCELAPVIQEKVQPRESCVSVFVADPGHGGAAHRQNR